MDRHDYIPSVKRGRRARIMASLLCAASLAAVMAACVPPDQPAASPTPAAAGTPASAPPSSPTPYAPPVGRSVGGETPRPDDVRVSGRLVSLAGAPARRVCVSVGPVPRCVVLSNDDGGYVIDLPQGPLQWTLRFWRDGREIAEAVTIGGPFPQQDVVLRAVVVD